MRYHLVIFACVCVWLAHSATALHETRAAALEELLESSSQSLSSILGSSSGSSHGHSHSRHRSANVQVPAGLQKATIVNPNDTPDMVDTLSEVSTVLSKEPAAAADPSTLGDLDAEETVAEEEAAEQAMDDVALMGNDDCNNPLPSEAAAKCSRGSQSGSSGSGSSGSSSGSSSSSSSSSLSSSSLSSMSGSSSMESSSGSSSDGGPVGQIRKLEQLIKYAMSVSKTIPENVRRLEELKVKEEQSVEKKARQEAVGTLEEHRRLMAEMAEHIVKLRAKLNELITKREQLEQSDERLRKELTQMSESSRSSSSSESSSGSSGSLSSSR